MTDEYLPQLARDVLAEVVPATAAPASLSARVAAVPTATEQGSVRDRLASVLRSLVRVAAVAGLVLAAGYLLSTGFANVAGVGTTSTSPPRQFDPTIDGQGIVQEANYHLRYAPLMLAALVSTIAIYVCYQRGRRALLGASGIVVGAILVALFVSNQPGVQFANATAPGAGISVDEFRDSDRERVFIIDAPPRETFGVFFNVTNRGDLPVRLEGLIGNLSSERRGARWTALGMMPGGLGIPGYAELEPFQPIDVAPNEFVLLYAVGRAGPCVLQPDGIATGAASKLSLSLAFSVLGLSWVNEPDLPFEVIEPIGQDCQPS